LGHILGDFVTLKRYAFVKYGLGHIWGDFFHKSIWSPWVEGTRPFAERFFPAKKSLNVGMNE
jgi:hypothetical protein